MFLFMVYQSGIFFDRTVSFGSYYKNNEIHTDLQIIDRVLFLLRTNFYRVFRKVPMLKRSIGF